MPKQLYLWGFNYGDCNKEGESPAKQARLNRNAVLGELNTIKEEISEIKHSKTNILKTTTCFSVIF